MTNASDPAGNLLPDSERLTGLGRFLRALSLDELPELFNILRGEMSLVGPRPLLIEYLLRYSPEQMRRHDAYPGLTGWAQINGRNATDWPTRLAMDVWYVDHWSFWLDIKIIFITLWKVLKREGINKPGNATVEYFKGNQEQ
jgi:lipopolysaccharide/colanic/teichoic acid biosynthesis glycosyltransferase